MAQTVYIYYQSDYHRQQCDILGDTITQLPTVYKGLFFISVCIVTDLLEVVVALQGKQL